jgi:hypothetical protein
MKKTLTSLSTDVIDIIKHIGDPNGKQCLIVAYASSTNPLYIISYVEGIKLIDVATAKTEEEAVNIANSFL